MNTLARVKLDSEATTIDDRRLCDSVALDVSPTVTATVPAAIGATIGTVVLICHLGRAGYNVQRALRAMGAKVYLIYDNRAASTRWSRGCTVLHHETDLADADVEMIILKINALHCHTGITTVIAADVSASLLLLQMKDRLLAPVYPVADLDALSRLDNKWEFAKLCRENDVAIPKTLYFAAGEPLDARMINDALGFPAIAKPAAGFGQGGIRILKTAADLVDLQADRRAAMVVQEYVIGQDWALSVFADRGVVTHWTMWECPDQLLTTGNPYGVARFLTTHFRNDDALIAMGREIIRATGYSGVANFDARRRTADGAMMMIECNPRFFNRMLAARICGLDFLAAGLPGFENQQRVSLVDGDHYPWQEIFTLRGLKLLYSGEWRVRLLIKDIVEMLRDPLPPIMRKLAHEEAKP